MSHMFQTQWLVSSSRQSELPLVSCESVLLSALLVCLSLCVRVCLYVCMCMRECMWVCLCVYVHVRACVSDFGMICKSHCVCRLLYQDPHGCIWPSVSLSVPLVPHHGCSHWLVQSTQHRCLYLEMMRFPEKTWEMCLRGRLNYNSLLNFFPSTATFSPVCLHYLPLRHLDWLIPAFNQKKEFFFFFCSPLWRRFYCQCEPRSY